MCESYFFPGGFPLAEKIFPVPQLTAVPAFSLEPVPPNWVLSPKFQKFYLIFLSILTTFQLKTTSESSISCLHKTPKFALNFAVGGHFWPQWTIFSNSPSSDSMMRISPIWLRPDGHRKIVPKIKSPLTKNFVKKPCICELLLLKVYF